MAAPGRTHQGIRLNVGPELPQHSAPRLFMWGMRHWELCFPEGPRWRLAPRRARVPKCGIRSWGLSPPPLLPPLQELMAGVVLLETALRAEFLKPFWSCWGFPAASPAETGACTSACGPPPG